VNAALDSRAQRRVLVVGGGPTGLTVANLLGEYGVPVLLVERNATTSDAAKAISIDGESLRTLQLAGLDGEVTKIVVPGTGTRYFSASGRPLFHAGDGGSHQFGHPFKNQFAQPELERALHRGLARFPHVEIRFETTLFALESRPDGAKAALRGADASVQDLDAFAVLACDGGRSTVRELLGIRMTGRSCEEIWLVLDALNDPHDQRYGMHHGDPDRPHVIVPGRDGRCRYEFLLRPSEGTPGQAPPLDLARELVRPYRDLRPEDVERSVVYAFHALVAERLHHHRCFLLGDAAHMMPPFAGQGLNSGIRDAANLAWKIASAYRGAAREPLLDTYDSERKAHAQAMVDFSVRLGEIVMTTSRIRAKLRDAAVRGAMRAPASRRYLTEMRFRPPNRISDGFLLTGGNGRRTGRAGTLLPQPRALLGSDHDLVRLDDALGPGFALIGVDVTDAGWSAAERCELPIDELQRVEIRLDDRAPRTLPARTSLADADGALQTYFADLGGHFVLVRPDRMIVGVVLPAELHRLSSFLNRFLCARAGHVGAPGRLRLPSPLPKEVRL